MSEYQFLKFRAIDRPLTEKQLEFMDQQSSRAEFSKWEFEVEYNYSSFHGDIDGMLRNGYDVFLTYANYGCLEVRMRLPNGLPFPKSVWSKYTDVDWLSWSADKSGKAGILTVQPCFEDAVDQIFEFDEYLDSTAKLRELLIAGDLRSLFVLWLCGAMTSAEADEELIEPPVPHGLGTVPREATALLEFFGADPLLVDAAAVGIPAFNAPGSLRDSVNSWLTSITDSRRAQIVQQLLTEDPVALKAELLSEVRDSHQAVAWPVQPPTRTMAQLLEESELLRQKETERQQRQSAANAKREAEKAEKLRQARMIEMKSSPESWLEKASQLVKERGTDNYREAASILADLRDAVGGKEGDEIARKHAAHLTKTYPTLNVLKSSLRKCNLLDS